MEMKKLCLSMIFMAGLAGCVVEDDTDDNKFAGDCAVFDGKVECWGQFVSEELREEYRELSNVTGIWETGGGLIIEDDNGVHLYEDWPVDPHYNLPSNLSAATYLDAKAGYAVINGEHVRWGANAESVAQDLSEFSELPVSDVVSVSLGEMCVGTESTVHCTEGVGNYEPDFLPIKYSDIGAIDIKHDRHSICIISTSHELECWGEGFGEPGILAPLADKVDFDFWSVCYSAGNTLTCRNKALGRFDLHVSTQSAIDDVIVDYKSVCARIEEQYACFKLPSFENYGQLDMPEEMEYTDYDIHSSAFENI